MASASAKPENDRPTRVSPPRGAFRASPGIDPPVREPVRRHERADSVAAIPRECANGCFGGRSSSTSPRPANPRSRGNRCRGSDRQSGFGGISPKTRFAPRSGRSVSSGRIDRARNARKRAKRGFRPIAAHSFDARFRFRSESVFAVPIGFDDAEEASRRAQVSPLPGMPSATRSGMRVGRPFGGNYRQDSADNRYVPGMGASGNAVAMSEACRPRPKCADKRS